MTEKTKAHLHPLKRLVRWFVIAFFPETVDELAMLFWIIMSGWFGFQYKWAESLLCVLISRTFKNQKE